MLHCRLPLKTTKEDRKDKHEAFASLATAADSSMDAAVAAIFSEMDAVFSLKEEQRTVLKVVLGRKDVFELFSTVFGKSLAKLVSCRHQNLNLIDGRLVHHLPVCYPPPPQGQLLCLTYNGPDGIFMVLMIPLKLFYQKIHAVRFMYINEQ